MLKSFNISHDISNFSGLILTFGVTCLIHVTKHIFSVQGVDGKKTRESGFLLRELKGNPTMLHRKDKINYLQNLSPNQFREKKMICVEIECTQLVIVSVGMC